MGPTGEKVDLPGSEHTCVLVAADDRVLSMNSRTTTAILAVVIIVVTAAALLYFGAGVGQKFQVSDLQMRSTDLNLLGSVSFTLSNQNDVPISSVYVMVNRTNPAYSPSDLKVSSSDPISPGQSRVLQFLYPDETRGQSYHITITVDFGDGSSGSYSATVPGE